MDSYLNRIEGMLGLHRHLEAHYEVDQIRVAVCDDSGREIVEATGSTLELALLNLAITRRQSNAA